MTKDDILSKLQRFGEALSKQIQPRYIAIFTAAVAILILTLSLRFCGTSAAPPSDQTTAADSVDTRPAWMPEGRPDQRRAEAFGETFAEQMPAALRRIGIRPDLIAREPGDGDAPDQWRIRVPSNFPLVRVNVAVTQIVREIRGKVYRAEQDSTNLRAVDLYIGAGNTVTEHVRLAHDRRLTFKGTIAIIIDDVGYRPPDVSMEFVELPCAVTLAILPNHRGAGARVAKAAIEHGHEVMLHLPMEPSNDEIPLEPKTILTTMNDAQIRKLTQEHIDAVPGVIGVNNHMGSKATDDPRVMNAVMDVLETNRLFFVDSRTSANSVAEDVARTRGVLTGRRHVFLDNENDTARIIEMLREAARIAARDGFAIAIGHDREGTYAALEQYLPVLEREGYRIAPVREVLR